MTEKGNGQNPPIQDAKKMEKTTVTAKGNRNTARGQSNDPHGLLIMPVKGIALKQVSQPGHC